MTIKFPLYTNIPICIDNGRPDYLSLCEFPSDVNFPLKEIDDLVEETKEILIRIEKDVEVMKE